MLWLSQMSMRRSAERDYERLKGTTSGEIKRLRDQLHDAQAALEVRASMLFKPAPAPAAACDTSCNRRWAMELALEQQASAVNQCTT